MGLLETAAVALKGGEQRTAIAARNIANAQTPGYKREIAFDQVLAPRAGDPRGPPGHPETATRIDHTQALLVASDNAMDLAIEGRGFLLVRDGDDYRASRGGRFMRDAEDLVVDGQGRVLQSAGGGDLRLEDAAAVEIVEDGTVLADGVPVAAIAIHAFAPEVAFDPATALDLAVLDGFAADEAPGKLRQGMLERSNVVLSDEMIGMMKTQRLAEGGAQLIRAYDQLIGQAITTFSRSR